MGAMAASPTPSPQADAYPRIYRPRNPSATPLFQLAEAHYEDVKSVWEDRFEKTHGRWRGFTDTVAARYLDCASPQAGFARLRLATPRDFIHMSMLFVLGAVGMPSGNGCRCPISTIGWHKSSSVIACSVC